MSAGIGLKPEISDDGGQEIATEDIRHENSDSFMTPATRL